MTISATAVPDGVPPRVDVAVAIPAGAVMDSVAVYRSTPTGRELLRQQPSEGFDSRTVSDFEMPYETELIYSWESSYVDLTAITAVWTEAWADLSAWTVVGADWAVSGGKLVWNGTDDPTASVSRDLTPDRYRIVLAAAPVGVQFIDFGELLFDVAASQVSGGGQAVTIVPGTGAITIDVTPSAVTVTTTEGVYSFQASVVLTQVAFVGAVASLVALSSVQVPLGVGVGQSESEPFVMAADDSGNLFVADSGNSRVLVYDFAGNYVTAFGSAGSGNGQFQDHMVWTIRTTPADNNWYAVAWSPELGLFAAVSDTGSGNRVMTSPNGINWTIRTSAANNQWRSIAWSPGVGLFCAVGDTGGVMTSPDGIVWTSRTSAAANAWHSVAWSPGVGLFCAVAVTGTGNRVMTSPDGITWTSRTSAADNDWRSVAWSPELGLFAAVSDTGSGNRVMTSPNGINWTIRTSAANNGWHSVAWSPGVGLFCAVSYSGTGNRVMTSPNGINWTAQTSAADNSWFSVIWSPELGLFCAVGSHVMTSPNGITWTIRTSAANNSWRSVAWSPELGLFAAVANTGTGNRVMTSPDLWSQITAVTTDGANVFVADGLVANAQTPRIQKFVPSGGTWVYNTKVGTAGTGNGQFGGFVGGLSAEPGGDVFATDSSNHRVQRFSNALVYEAKTGSNGSTAGKFISPGPVAVFGSKVAVGDSTGRVQLFTLALVYDQTIPQGFGDGSIYRPLSMAGDAAVLYVISAQSLPTRGGPSRLSKLSQSGTYLGGVLNVGTVEIDDPEGSGEYPNAVAVRPSTRDVAVLTFDGLVRRYSQPAASIDDVTASGYGTTIFVSESSLPVTISPADAWIIHPARPGVSFPVSNDTGPITSFFGDFGSIDNAANSTVHEVLGTDRPVVTTSGPRGSDQLTVTVVTETRDRELALYETLRDQTPLLIRVPPSWGADFADGFYSVGTVTRDRIGATFRHLRSFTLPLIAVESPDVTVQNSGWSWAALAAEFPTWADVQAAFATWSDVATNTRQPGF